MKCIFIDPPYNTKSAFEHYDGNLEHSQWLSMMLPRPQLLRELLSEDGSIWVHLDDNEAQYNKVLMDEVYGRRNFVANVCWQKSYAVRSNAEFFSTAMEHVVVYARQRDALHMGKFGRSADLVLDSFLGSGTTAAVAHKMGRRWIGIEMGEHALTHCLPRLRKVVEGEQGGISQAVGWQGGGGFRLLQLGAPLFDADGEIHADVRFADLAAFVWMTGTALADLLPATPKLGAQGGTAYCLLFNGILGDRRPEGGNVLTSAMLAALQQRCPHPGPKVIYGEACRLGAARLDAEGIVFKHAVPR